MEKAVWNVKLYGGRGSTPVCESDFQKYGGNTTCIYIDLLINNHSKLMVIFDAGTGIRQLANDIETGSIPKADFILLIFTHLHWDHIQGFPFFSPLYNPNQKIGVVYPKKNLKIKDVEDLFALQMQKEFFPVQLENMGSDLQFINYKDAEALLSEDGLVTFSFREHNHPGGAFSYKLEAGGKSIVISTDLEHGKEIDKDVVDFCKNADLLIHDAQYTDEELALYEGWGHSSFNQAIETAALANVKNLVLTHHDPSHDDTFLSAIEKECKSKFKNSQLAKEGMEFNI
ncbi:MBL fold metallo-hydrolase [Polaribacter sp. IC073]|uniref:MBL fold metallo-hydrolase n=1 Tax=Polaribacter sp. IC073 TaxID=2508540 RepID=UPI0011BDF811|nr:MBL fold metallo-hydrolase [Polaribacter sp. IC073]TXD47204.1 MBL fold metallo-hydrolase [Polaribacter sp. IC073]